MRFVRPFRLHARLAASMLLSLATVGSSGAAARGGPPPLYGVDPNRPDIHSISPANGNPVSSASIAINTAQTVVGATGVAQDPITGQVWVLLELQGQVSHQLATIDPATGAAVSIGDTGDLFDGLTFASDGTLYGVTGDGATASETLFTLDKTTGAPAFVMSLGNGGFGEAIAFNPDDGLIYHFSGSPPIFESINPFDMTITPISLSGDGLTEVIGVTYAGGGSFLVTELNLEFAGVTTAGVASLLGSTSPERLRGLAFDNAAPDCDAGGPYATMSDGSVTFDGSGSSDPDGSVVTYDWDFGDGNFAMGVAPSHTYAVPDVYTVTLTVRDDLGRYSSCSASVAFDDPGDPPLYGITPFAGGAPVVSIVRISRQTGTPISSAPLSIDTGTATGGNGLATHPSTGQMYAIMKVQGQTNRKLATIDPSSGSAVEIGDMGDRFASMTFAPDGTLYAVTGDGGNTPESLFTIDPGTGASTLLMNLGNGNDGDVIAFNPDDGLIYHFSGNSLGGGGDLVFETVDPVTQAVTPIPITGDAVENEPIGMYYAGSGLFLVSHLNDPDIMTFASVTSSGFTTIIGETTPWFLRGLADDPSPVAVDDEVAGVPVPSATRLLGNRPNPFNPRTTIRYELGAAGPVTLRVLDPSGRLVRVLVDAVAQQAGRYAVSWDGTDERARPLASGVYFYRLSGGAYDGTRRMVLLK